MELRVLWLPIAVRTTVTNLDLKYKYEQNGLPSFLGLCQPRSLLFYPQAQWFIIIFPKRIKMPYFHLFPDKPRKIRRLSEMHNWHNFDFGWSIGINFDIFYPIVYPMAYYLVYLLYPSTLALITATMNFADFTPRHLPHFLPLGLLGLWFGVAAITATWRKGWVSPWENGYPTGDLQGFHSLRNGESALFLHRLATAGHDQSPSKPHFLGWNS